MYLRLSLLLLLVSFECFAIKNNSLTLINQTHRPLHLHVYKAIRGNLWRNGEKVQDDTLSIAKAKSYAITHLRGKAGVIGLVLSNKDGQHCDLIINGAKSVMTGDTDDIKCLFTGQVVEGTVSITGAVFRRD